MESAHRLTRTMAQSYRDSGNIFINPADINDVTPDSPQVFDDLMGRALLPRENIYMTGGNGLKICPDAAKIIVHDKPKDRCCGRWGNCRCHHGHEESHHIGD